MEEFCTYLMDINWASVNGTLASTLGDISPIHIKLKNNYFLNKSLRLLRGKELFFYCPEVNFGLMIEQAQSIDVNHLFCYCDLTYGTSRATW